MKPLANHILIYDKDCPLCTTYTKLFLKYGFLDENGRKAYQEMDFLNTNIDTEIAKNKIALIHTDSGEVTYGIDAITKVIGNSLPFVSFFMKFKPLHWFMTQFYSLISYNRKIIIPVNCNDLASCNPSKNWFWRIAFVLLCIIPIQFVMPPIHRLLFSEGYSQAFLMVESVVFMSLIIFQLFCCKIFGEKNIYDYLGHLSFISALGASSLIVLYLILKIFAVLQIDIEGVSPVGYNLIFMWMLIEHHRRMKLLEMKQGLTWSWILFSIAIWVLFYSL